MGWFDHSDDEPESATFMGLVLDDEGLLTPVGLMPLGEITRAEFLRDIVEDGYGPDETSTAAVAGGAVAGAVVFGPVGAVAGGLAGSTVKEQGPAHLTTRSVRLIFDAGDLHYQMDIPRDQEGGAITFAETVKRAVKHHKG